MTLSEWFEYYLNTYCATSLKQSTADSYRSIFNNHIKPYIGHVELSQLDFRLLQDYFNNLYYTGRIKDNTGLSAKTVQNVHRVLHKALRIACMFGYINNNPSELVQLPRYRKKPLRAFTETEQQLIIEAAPTVKYGLEIMLALTTGLRLGEVLGIQWQDCDFDSNIIRICHTVKRVRVNLGKNQTSLQVTTPKSDSSNRTIPVLPDIMLSIKARKASSVGDFVFGKPDGSPNDPRKLEDCFSRLLKRLNISGASFHTLRHTFATRCMESDIPVKVVSDILGHSTTVITLDYYQHTSINEKKKALDRVNALSFGIKNKPAKVQA